jgi:hypothetical protein
VIEEVAVLPVVVVEEEFVVLVVVWFGFELACWLVPEEEEEAFMKEITCF